MPDVARRARGCWGRKVFAFWLAALVALAPFADRGLPHGSGDQPLIQSSNPQLDALAQSREPVAAPRLGQAARERSRSFDLATTMGRNLDLWSGLAVRAAGGRDAAAAQAAADGGEGAARWTNTSTS